MLRFAIVIIILCMTIPALAHDESRHAQLDPATRDWINNLKNRLGINCCSTADGYPLNGIDVQYDTKAGKFRVRIEGGWFTVEDDFLLTEPNRLGHAIVWWYRGEDGLPVIRCFIEGAGG